jgi:hypothetical protein
LPARLPPALRIESRFDDPASALMQFIDNFDGRILFTAESPGRREAIIDLLHGRGLRVDRVEDWPSFMLSAERICVAIAAVDNGVVLERARLAVISEQQLFGELSHVWRCHDLLRAGRWRSCGWRDLLRAVPGKRRCHRLGLRDSARTPSDRARDSGLLRLRGFGTEPRRRALLAP